MPDFFELIRSGKEQKVLDKIDCIDVGQTNELGRTLLHVAIAHGRKRIVQELIARKAELNVSDKQHGYTPLHVAAEYGDPDIITSLISAGADPNVADRHGNSPLWTAVFRSRGHPKGLELVKTMVDAGADPSHKNTSGRSPLDMAMQFEEDDLILLLESRMLPRPRKGKPRK